MKEQVYLSAFKCCVIIHKMSYGVSGWAPILRYFERESRMKMSFINPGPNEILSEGEKTMIAASPPLGILYIASKLREIGMAVSAYDQASVGSSVGETVSWVQKENPDILGFSTLLTSSYTAPKLAEAVKNKIPDIPIVFGNQHATFNAERILRKYPFVDIIVRGEGEQACEEIAECFEGKRELKEILGITFRKKDKIISTPNRPLTNNVDSLPLPARDLLVEEYHNNTIGVNVAPKKFTTFVSSRGCVFRCRFCNCASFARNLWRPRSVVNIVNELNLLASEGYEQLMFVDDNFTLNPKRVIRLCERIRKDKIDIEWICEGRVDQCSYDMLRHMVKAGCRMMYFGIESGVQKVLDYFNKRITPEQSKAAVDKARKAGMDIIVGSFVVGAPCETQKDIQKTLEFAANLDLDIPQLNILGAFPGNEIWEELKQEGLNEEQYWETGAGIPDVYANAVPLNVIKRMISDHYKRFLLNPRYISKEILRTFRSSYRLDVVISNLARIGTVIESTKSYIHKT